MEEENSFTHSQSLSVIEQMIAAAKNEHHEKGDGWLMWGWLLFIASMSSAICLIVGYNDYIQWIWAGMAVTGIVVGFIFSFSRKKKKGLVVTYVQDLLTKLGAGFFIS